MTIPDITIYDTHAHLTDAQLQADLVPVLANAAQAGVTQINVIGYDAASNAAACQLAASYPQLHATVGYQPTDVAGFDAAAYTTLTQQAQQAGVVAIGEIGLDYYWDTTTPAAQQAAFQAQLTLAKTCDLPVVVHNRDAFDDVYAFLAASGCRGVIHSFSGTAAEAQAFLDLGLMISFSGMVTFKNAPAIREAALIVPADQLLLETDAPYLAPVPYRGKRNEPGYTRATAEFLADLRGVSLAELAQQTTANACRLFQRHD